MEANNRPCADLQEQQDSGGILPTSSDKNQIVKVKATPGRGRYEIEISYVVGKYLGRGSFGVVKQAKLCPSGELVAIKKSLLGPAQEYHEADIMRQMDHCNIIKLFYFYYSTDQTHCKEYLHLVLEYLPETLHKVEREYAKKNTTMPINLVRLYMYQLFRALAYMDVIGICHRDIKPHNILVDSNTGILKVCDFGNSKLLNTTEKHEPDVCTRFYCAPEMLLKAVHYTTKVDIWSAGCTIAELLLGKILFRGEEFVDQMVTIIKVLGTPTKQQILLMNPNYNRTKCSIFKQQPWEKVFQVGTSPDAINLISQLLVYEPEKRITAITACAHKFFDVLRQKHGKPLLNGLKMPSLFNFTSLEVLSMPPNLISKLTPKSLQNNDDTLSEGALTRSRSRLRLLKSSGTTLI